MSPLPLAGLRVLDLSRGGGAAACAHLLEQLGADREPRDVTSAPGRGREVAKRHDLVVSDLLPAEARALGLEPSGLAAPEGGVVVSVTPFGLEGPHAGRPSAGSALDVVDPRLAAALAGAHAAVAALAALRWTRRRHRPVQVEVAELEVIASCLGDLLPPVLCPRWRPDDTAARRMDRRVAVLPCADGYVGIAAPTEDDRALLAAMAGLPTMGEETDLGDLLSPWLRGLTRDEVFHTAQLWRLPCVPVLDPEEVRRDEQCEARGVWIRRCGEVVARSPFRFTPSPAGENPEAFPEGHPGRSRFASATSELTTRPQPLSDLRVLDLGMVWAGPHCGRLLAALGAQVAKIEGPARRDGTRPPTPHGCSGVFSDLNRGKSSLVLDLSTGEGRDLFLRLAAEADVVVENFSPRVMPNFGLGHSALQAANPALLTLSMPAFGAGGPWSSYVAYGSGLELATGLAGTDRAGLPAPAAVAYLDYLSGAYGAAGLLAALLARDPSGRGTHLEVAQREVACQLLPTGATPEPRPPALSLSPEALAADPHLAHRGLFGTAEDGSACRHLARPPWRLHGVPGRQERPAPGFGTDSRRLLRRWAGLDAAELERLAAAGVVGVPARGSRRPS